MADPLLAPASLLSQIVARLDRSGVPAAKFPDRKGEYWAHCPFHKDAHPNNFSVSEAGYRCFSCGAKGGLRALAEKFGLPIASRWHGGTVSGGVGTNKLAGGYTVEQYGQDKGLPLDFLQHLGLSDRKLNGKTAVRIPYRDDMGRETLVRYRIAASGDKFRWSKGAKLTPYGLERLDRARGYVHLLEGESDAQTLWLYGEPALGVPGASTWKAEWAEHLAGLTVYVWQEPDEGGATFVRTVAASLPDAKVTPAPKGRKDVSECHLKGEDVPALLAGLRKGAQPVSALEAKQTAQAADAARRKAGLLASSPNILDRFLECCRAQGLVGEEKIVKLLYLALTSRLLDHPISVVVKGPSSGGKSFTVETVLKAFPDAAYYALSAMSERALAYGDEPLEHRHLVLYEAAGMAGDMATYLMRSLLSEGHIRYDTVEKTGEGLRPRSIERPGPTGLILTTTAASLHPENETRLFSVTVRDTPEQTAAVLAALAERAGGGTSRANGKEKAAAADLAPWQALQEWLALGGKREVVVPYARRLAELTTACGVRLRRDFGATLGLIQAHAILHQETRPRDHQGRIVATPEDYAAVYELVIDVISEGVQASVKPEVRQVVEAVRLLDTPNAPPVTFKRVGEHLRIDKSAARRRCEVALREGYLVNRQDKRNQPAVLGLGDPLPADRPVLPPPDELFGPTSPSTVPPCHRPDDAAAEMPGEDDCAALGLFPEDEDDGPPPEAWQQSFLDEAGGGLWDANTC